MERIGSAGVKFLDGNVVEPLIEAAETYPALEKAIAEARQTIHLAYWTIDPTMAVVSDAADGVWADLIADAIERGLTVRLVIADFDPILGRRYHETAWSSYRRFMALRDRFDSEAGARLQIICSRHEARVGTAVRILGQAVIQKMLTDAVNELNELAEREGREASLTRLGRLPGLWPHIEVVDGAAAVAHPTLPTAYPAAHHEKLCIVDDRLAFLGGLDINTKRYDTEDHEDEFAWHDVACRLEGPAAGFFATHFRERWNSEGQDFLRFLADAEAPEGVEAIPTCPQVGPIDLDVRESPAARGKARVAPLRTISSQAKSTLSRSPESSTREILDAYRSAIAEAEHLIYIETQFLRSKTIVDCLLERAKQNERLEVMVLLPLVPEEALVPGEPDIATKHGQHLQNEWLTRLREEIGARFGVFTLLRDGPADPDPVSHPKRTERDLVYVHAKVMVVDAALAIIGSPNLNDRSMLTDTETAIAWREPPAVKRFQDRLWHHALGIDAADWQSPFVEKWATHANRNARLPAAQRRGFVVPMTESAASAHAEPSLVVPDELI